LICGLTEAQVACILKNCKCDLQIPTTETKWGEDKNVESSFIRPSLTQLI